ncbi:hypothetical protein ACGC1H_004011 [Rhizoctonia solani]|uniref:Uncharacterized protein n=1 Tax=Rhizoctonia solani TaxID=456999 RepID=A0A8H3GDD1_9AGAM|nr:unnamed protein product [Rhizoctonia solani]
MTLDTALDTFLLSTSDILEGPQKTYIKCSKTGEIKWCKTRTLTLHEVIDELHAGSELAYSIHRPTRGWYIRIKAHGDPSLVVDLIPDPLVDTTQPDADSALVFTIPGVGKGKERESVGSSLADQDEYSFPPTPPIRSPPRKKRNPDAKPGSLLSEPSSPTSAAHTDPLRSPDPPQSAALKLQPRLQQPQPGMTLLFSPTPVPKIPPNPSFSRAFASGLLRVVTNTIFSPPRRSFSLSARSSGGISATTPGLESGPRFVLEKVLEYEDTTPVFSVSQMTGVVTVLNGGCGDIGLLIACAMAYLDFLAEREGYIAAANGG